MNAGAIEHQDCVLSPIRILAVEVDDQPVQKRAQNMAIDGRLKDCEEALAEVVDGRDERQSVAERLLVWPESLVLDAPALMKEVSPSQTRLIDIYDAFAGHHLVDESQSELLALISAADDIGAASDGLDCLVDEPELLAHDIRDELAAEPLRMARLNMILNLCDA